MRLPATLYGGVAYTIFLVTFLYAIGFVGNVVVPKSIDAGLPASAAEESLALSLLVDVLLLGVFAIQHSLMARPAFKRWWTRVVPPVVERSTYVLLASLALLVLFLEWRPIPGTLWDLRATPLGWALAGTSALGWALVLASTFQIDHFELFGLKQVWRHWRGRAAAEPEFRVPPFYRHVRHPIYVGFMLAFWSTPVMSAGHLLFAAMTSAYILVGIAFEERDLVAQFGDRYRAYRREVGMLLPRLGAAGAPVHERAEPHPPARDDLREARTWIRWWL
ncbi:methanethiol S-methyltransferase [Piscinibacter koreensis]|uniref:methanethiol S-methyltransferase n=1 Tax=Piscinibacter koreensis TaxID=2742824 RepID=A0A7Y6NS45_9BURK|nr:methanethiol S-methyltransferase [Schlegelella koreensis]NUZ08324.1 isoprenylcysteine carboxylmethyltransferase family protein [Schlegelella koreensis]